MEKEIKEIEEEIYNCDYDSLSDYGRAIRDFCNYLNNSEEITQEDIIKEVSRLQQIKRAEEGYKPTIKEIEEYIFKNMPSEVEEWENYKKTMVKDGVDLSESLFIWLVCVKKDSNVAEKVKEILKERWQNNYI